MFVFTPPHSWAGMGTVVLEQQPTGPTSPARYRELLAKRLMSLMLDADEADLIDVLSRLSAQEGINVPRALEVAAASIVQGSQSLRESAAYPVEPIDPSEWQRDPETLEALGLESAIDYLEMLVR